MALEVALKPTDPFSEHDDPPYQGVGRTAAWLAKQVETGVADADLTVPQYRVLGLLDTGTTGASRLAGWLAVRPASVTAVVDGLVGRGFVDRQPAADDRRRVVLAITAQGRQVLTVADRGVDARLRRLASALGDPDAEAAAMGCFGLWQRAMVATAGGAPHDARARALERGA